MRKIIINADDLGLTEQRSHGIFLCHEQGVVTSCSLIVTTDESERASRHAAEKELPTGLHINLTEGSALSKKADIETLLTTDGYLLGYSALVRRVEEKQIDPLHVEREVRAQMEWFLENRGFPTHVDSHHHVHIHPLLSQMMVSVLDQYAVPYVRIPCEESVPFGYLISAEQSARIENVSKQATEAKKLYAAHGLKFADHFLGLAFAGNASQRNLRHTLGRLAEGVTEFMVHPGSPNPHGNVFERDPQRQTEMNILMNPETKEEFASRKIGLTSYGEML